MRSIPEVKKHKEARDGSTETHAIFEKKVFGGQGPGSNITVSVISRFKYNRICHVLSLYAHYSGVWHLMLQTDKKFGRNINFTLHQCNDIL